MGTKTKKPSKTEVFTDNLTDIAQQAGVVLMTAAATIGMLEIPEHPNKIAIVPSQPVIAMAGPGAAGENQLRREREETAPHFISYAETQRTPARSGKQ